MKRILAMVLCLMMAAIPALAAEDNTQQIANWGASTPAGWYDPATHTHNNANLKLNEDGVAISKTITPTENENYFDITLKVASEYTFQELVREPSVDVVIVLDKSNTMKNAMENTSRIEAAKASAVSFINGFYSNKMFKVDSKHRLAFVTFNTHAETVFALDSGLSKANMIKKINALEITTDNSSTERFTNIEGGLRLAQNLLKGSKADNKFIVFISDGFPTTYIQSGENSKTKITGYNPTTASATTNKDGVFADRMTGQANNAGTNYSDRAALYAQNAAKEIKDSGINIYSIGIDIGTTTVWSYLWRNGNGYYPTIDRFNDAYYKKNGNTYVIGEPVSKYANKKDPGVDYTGKFKAWLKDKISGGPDCPNGLYADGDTPKDLTKALENILDEIIEINSKELAESWVVSDPMSQYVEFQYFYNQKGNPDSNGMTGSNGVGKENSVSLKNGNAIAWKLFESGYETIKVGNKNVHVYELKYRIRLKNETGSFVTSENKSLATNGTTTFEYKIIENDELTEEDEMEFTVPEVEGYLYEVSFIKENSDTNAFVEGAVFTLTHDKACPVCGGDAKHSKYTAVSTKVEKNGQRFAEVRFKNIPSGHTYWLEEAEAPIGYEPTFEKRLVEVTYDYLTNVDDIVEHGVANGPLYWPTSIAVPVKKIVADSDVFAKTDMQNFVFELYACDANGNVTGDALASKSPDASGNLEFSGLDAFVFDEYADTKETRYFLIKEKAGSNLHVDYDDEREYLVTVTASVSDTATKTKPAASPASDKDALCKEHGAFPLIASKTVKVRETANGEWKSYANDTPAFTNTDKVGSLTFVKKNADTGAVLAGAEFTLTHDAQCSACGGNAQALSFTQMSGQDGKVTFTNVPTGHEYVLAETKAPAGYEISFASRKVLVGEDGVTNFEDIAANGITNKPVYQPDAITIPVKKIVAADDVYAKADMQKFVFELYACDENGNVTGAALASKSPDTNGDLVFSGLDAFVFDDYADSGDTRYFLVKEVGGTNLYIDYDVEHEYLFTATAALSDAPVNGKFVFTANKTMKIRENGGDWQETSAAAAEFTNTDKASGFSFVKKNADTGAALAGAVFTLTHDAGCEACNGNARELVFTATSDTDGKISFESVPAGHEYVLEETKAPAGYEISFAKRTVKVTDSNVLNFEDIAADGIANKPLYWPDDISVAVEKKVGEDDVYAKADMQKFVFELYACDESGNVTGAALASKSPDEDGKVVFEGINEFLFDDYKDSKETRHFLIKEFRGSNPFIVYDSERAYLITASAALSQAATSAKPEGTPASENDEKLAANGAFALTASMTIKFRETPNDAWQIYGGNAAIFANSDCKRTGFEFTKVSSFNDRELNGAEFTLTHSAGCGCGYTHQDIPAIIVEAVNGKVIFGDKVETQILTGHKYLLKETKAPNGFELMNGVTYTVRADADGNVTYTRNETSGGKPIAGDSMMTRGLYENRPDYLPLSIEIEARKLYNNEIPVNTGENYMFALFDEEITENNFGLLNTPSTLPTLKGTKGFIEYVYNDSEGKIKFTPITVEKAGTYTYWILEIPGTIADVKYDKTIYKVTVTVDETVNPDGSGTPVVEYTYEANGQACYTDGLPTFNNYFVPDTGDRSNILFWLMLLGCTGCVMAMMIRRRKEN